MRTLGIVKTNNVLKHSKKGLLLGVVTSPISFFTLKMLEKILADIIIIRIAFLRKGLNNIELVK